MNKGILQTKAYINGNWVSGLKGSTFAVLNPFDGKEIAKVSNLGKKEARQAIEAAYWAFPLWSALLASERAQKLKDLAELIKHHAQDLANLLTTEQGKSLRESTAEVLLTADLIHWLSEEAGRIHGLTQCDPDKDRSALTIRQPMGVVAVITPWNFPFSIPAQKTFAALAAGCTVVLKPAEDTPLSALALAYLSHKAGIPPGVFNVVTCENPEEVGDVFTSHPLVRKVTFTGSTEVGKKILAMSAPTVKKVTLELGGNCPLIVFEDADLQKALQGVLELKFLNSGQCCNSINRLLIHRSIYDAFVDNFIDLAKKLTVGSGLESANICPLINQQSKNKIEELIKDASEKGAEVIMTKKKQKGLLMSPIIIKHASENMRIYNEEIFGPVAAFYPFDTEDEAIAMANDTSYGLAAYFYTENLTRAMRVAKMLEAGSVGINTTNVYSHTLPFGGWKESGLGREGGISDILNDYCELKAISVGK